MVLKKLKKTLKSFKEESRAREFVARVDRGVQIVPIKKIVGSLGRWLDFNADFSMKGEHSRHRLDAVKQALSKDRPLPIVELYEMDDEFYVVDGHHRIAAAKALGQKFVDAHVVEYYPAGDNSENLLIRKRTEFELKTGLQEINLSHRDDYDMLLLHVEQHKNCLEHKSEEEISLRGAARDWSQSLYYPIAEKREGFGLNRYFPNATAGDIYAYLCEQMNLPGRGTEAYDVNLEEALKELEMLAKTTRLIFANEGMKEKLLKILMAVSLKGNVSFVV